jgi:hypothetical protein
MFESRQFESKHNLILSRKGNCAMGTEPTEDDKTQEDKSRYLLYISPSPRTYYISWPCAGICVSVSISETNGMPQDTYQMS